MRYKIVSAIWLLGLFGSSKQQELCGPLNGRTIYLQLGEQGSIVHYNQTTVEKYVSRCGLELVTCPACAIQISIEHLDLPQHCIENTLFNTSSEYCPCAALSLWEPSGHYGPTHMCSLTKDNVFTSSTRSVGISFDFISQNWTGSFSISYIAQRNQIFESGLVGQSGFINTPNFPSLYPRDFGIEHVISCMSDDCIVSLLFSDFLISPSSLIEFYDWDGKPLHLVSGRLARPPPILSSGSSLIVRFFGNGGTSMGYKAKYNFIQNSTQNFNSLRTECGGEVDSLGGTIYMTELTGLYDCIWIILPASSISHFKTHLYLKVLEFTGAGDLSLRFGQTSESRLIEVITDERKISTEHVAPISKGFYVSLRASLHTESKLVIAYTAFAYMDCLSGLDHLCKNKRCISNHLMCDKIDNCGDNSDEFDVCKEESLDHPGQYWWPVRGAGAETVGPIGGVLLSGVGALIAIALMMAAALCRMALRPRPPATAHTPLHTDHARTIAHLLNMGELDDRDDPPMYEPPPEYNQVVKPSRPRRKHSAQRLIERDLTTPNHCDDDLSLPSTSLTTGSKAQYLGNHSIIKSVDVYSGLVPKRISESSPPVSLETTGYDEQDLELSLTLSTTSQKGDIKHLDLHWPSTSNRFFAETATPSNLSAVSFETLHSSQERVLNTVPRLTKCYSQDNILWLRTGFNEDQNTSGDFSLYASGGNTTFLKQKSEEQSTLQRPALFIRHNHTHRHNSLDALEVAVASSEVTMSTEPSTGSI